jgi:AcrR family transcriptional regulator
MVSAASTRTRASALPIEERRAAIVAAALPLFLEHGGAITTREVASAAGIAEGTIFRVFADKRALLEAVVDAALDPTPTEAALRAIDPALDFEERVVSAVEVLRERVMHVFRVMAAATTAGEGPPGATKRPPPELRELVALFEPEASRLRCSPTEAAHLLRGLAFAGTHRSFVAGAELSPRQIASVLLDGIRRDPGRGRRC